MSRARGGSRSIAPQAILIALAALAAFAPLSPSSVDRYYANWIYPEVQARLTAWSNLAAVSLFDALLAVSAIGLLAAWWRWIRSSRRARSIRPLARGLVTSMAIAAAAYLWFEGAWGFNYARSPLELAVGYDESRVSAAAVRALAERTLSETNRAYAAAHARGFPAPGDAPGELAQALHAIEQRLGRPRPTLPSRPKRSALALFFRWSGVDGMHAPFMLETLLNPYLTPPERPAVLAHEWAHLSGYAPEDDASFVGLLAALRADPASKYSAWLTLFHDAVSQLPMDEQREMTSRLEEGPRADTRAIAARLNDRVDLVARASWLTYDRYLKAQGVQEGVRSYSRVVQLIVGSGALDW